MDRLEFILALKEREDSVTDDNVSTISSDILKDLSEDKRINEDEKLRDILLNIVYALDLLNNKTNANKSLLTKLDVLTANLRNGNTDIISPQQPHVTNFEGDIEDLITRKKELEWQYMRAEQLSLYYDELLWRDGKPFVPFQFRAKVNTDISQRQKTVQEQKSINNVKVEIRLMAETMETCQKQLRQLNLEIKNYLESACLKKVLKNEYKTKIQENEEDNKIKWETVFNKIKRRCEKDIDSGRQQYLLRFLDKEHFPHVQIDQGHKKNVQHKTIWTKTKGSSVKTM